MLKFDFESYFLFHLEDVFAKGELFKAFGKAVNMLFPILSFKLRINTYAVCSRPTTKKGFPRHNPQQSSNLPKKALIIEMKFLFPCRRFWRKLMLLIRSLIKLIFFPCIW